MRIERLRYLRIEGLERRVIFTFVGIHWARNLLVRLGEGHAERRANTPLQATGGDPQRHTRGGKKGAVGVLGQRPSIREQKASSEGSNSLLSEWSNSQGTNSLSLESTGLTTCSCASAKAMLNDGRFAFCECALGVQG